MKNGILIAALILYVGSALFSCNRSDTGAKVEDTEEQSWRAANEGQLARLYPNGGEELAWIMREVTHKLEEYKIQLEEGEEVNAPELKSVLEQIHGAKSIRKEAGTPPFNGMTNALIQQYESLQNAEGGDVVNSFNLLIQNCEACHQAYCPGPLKRIQKLRIQG
jgi:hypothetical protein